MSSMGQLVPPTTRSTQNVTTDQNKPHIEATVCLASIHHNYDPALAVICSMYILFGIVYTLFGYRCFKASMFLTGFTFASIIIYLICQQEYLMPPYGNVCVALCAGLLFGLITMLIQYVGLFITGFHTGMLTALASLAIYTHFMVKLPALLYLCLLLLLSGVVFAVLNLVWKKAFTIFGTSVYGGAVIIISLDYFFEEMVIVNWMWTHVSSDPEAPLPCHLSWVILALWPTTTFVGILLQSLVTSTGIHHELSIRAQKRRLKGLPSRPVTREQRAEMKQRKYRYLYQVRTAHGDVISQQWYVRALQKKAVCDSCEPGSTVGGGECSTLQSDSTHLTVLAGSEPPPNTDSDDELRPSHVHR